MLWDWDGTLERIHHALYTWRYTNRPDAKRDELSKLNGAAFDKVYVANEIADRKSVNSALESTLIPSANNAEYLETVPQHQEFAMDPRCAPERIFLAHPLDQVTQTMVNLGMCATGRNGKVEPSL